MASAATTIEVRGLGKQKIGELAEQASRFGMTPEEYVKYLVEENLAIAREARSTTFRKLMGSEREVDESALDRLVEAAKIRHHRRTAKKR